MFQHQQIFPVITYLHRGTIKQALFGIISHKQLPYMMALIVLVEVGHFNQTLEMVICTIIALVFMEAVQTAIGVILSRPGSGAKFLTCATM